MGKVDKTILITGNCGYIGSVLTEECLKKGYRVIGYDILMHGKEHMAQFEENPNLKIITGDIRDIRKLGHLIEESDVIVHLAAIARVDNCIHLENEMKEINTKAAIDIAKLCKKYNKKMIFASSCSLYGLLDKNEEVNEDSKFAPTTIYAKNKLAAEQGILNSGANAIICRFATAYGQSHRMRYDLFINEVLRDAFIKKKVDIIDPNLWRCYIHIRDITMAILFFLEKNNFRYNIFNVGSLEQNLTKKMIIDKIIDEIGEFQINVIKDEKDLRNYKINFNRIYSEGFSVDKSIKFGINEMVEFLSKKNVDLYDKKFTNYKDFNYGNISKKFS